MRKKIFFLIFLILLLKIPEEELEEE